MGDSSPLSSSSWLCIYFRQRVAEEQPRKPKDQRSPNPEHKAEARRGASPVSRIVLTDTAASPSSPSPSSSSSSSSSTASSSTTYKQQATCYMLTRYAATSYAATRYTATRYTATPYMLHAACYMLHAAHCMLQATSCMLPAACNHAVAAGGMYKGLTSTESRQHSDASSFV